MTFAIAWTWARQHLTGILVALVVLLAVVAGAGWQRAHQLGAEIGAARRGAELRAAGQLVPETVSVGTITAAAAKLAAGSPVLAGELLEAHRVAPDAQVVQVLEAATAPAVARGKASPRAPAAPASPSPVAKGEAPPIHLPDCLLAEGDRLQLRLQQVTLDDQGARLIKGVMSAHRLDADGSDVLLLEEPIAEQLSSALEVPAPPVEDLRGGFGALGGVARGSWVVGALGVTSAWRVPLVHWRLSLAGVALAGPEAWVLTVWPFARF